jgi:hypothetical protein
LSPWDDEGTMARTKQKVRDEWQERKLNHAASRPQRSGGTGGAGQSSESAAPSARSGEPESSTAAAEEDAPLEVEAEADDGEEGEEEEEYEVEEIVDERTYRNKLQFQVKWKGFDEVTWEPAAHLKDTAALTQWRATKREREAAAVAAAAGEEDESSSDSDSGGPKRRGGRRKRDEDSDYVEDDSEEELESESSDDDEEYVPEGGRRSSRTRGKIPSPSPGKLFCVFDLCFCCSYRFVQCRSSLICTELGCPPRNFSRQTPQHAAELIAAQLTRPPSVGTHKLSDQQHAFAKHRAMRSSPAPKHDACAVVSEDTIAIAAAVSHADGESNCAARGCCPQHR